MKVLVVGSGGREHALAWKIRKSNYVTWLGVAPGNGGTKNVAENVDIAADDIEGIARYARDNDINLTVIGPEAPLAEGITELFDVSKNNLVFGPSQKAAMLESSKRFSKELMASADIPTAAFRAFRDPRAAKEYVNDVGGPLVIKASGLAAGKGVLMCDSTADALNAVDDVMTKNAFGTAGSEIVIEEMLNGWETSIMVITDGESYVMMPPSQDHKRIGEGDTGLNTGGMGAYSPTPLASDELVKECAKTIIEPTLKEMRDNGTPYRGVLYAGIMVTDDGPKVLEYNCRFGDPETQAVLPMLTVDLVDLMLLSATGKMGDMINALNLDMYDWKRISRTGNCVTVVLAADGYPESYEKGKIITGLTPDNESLVTFHAGTKWSDGKLVTSGGRVLAVSALGGDLQTAIDRAYKAADDINFEGKYLRRDIAWRALKA